MILFALVCLLFFGFFLALARSPRARVVATLLLTAAVMLGFLLPRLGVR